MNTRKSNTVCLSDFPSIRHEPCVRVYGDEEIIISATTGRETIFSTKDMFKGYLHPDFAAADIPGVATPDTQTKVFELRQSLRFQAIFKSIDDMILTQGQIVAFCKEHPNRLHVNFEGYCTLFLFECRGELSVANVSVDGRNLRIFHYKYSSFHFWSAYLTRFVVPLWYHL